MAWTIDDLLYYGWSLWSVVRGVDGAILEAVRVPPEWWQIDPDNRITINGVIVEDPASVILFPGPDEGLCVFACRTIRAAKNVESAWAGRIRNPVPLVDLHRTSDNEMLDEEVVAMIDDFTMARRDVNGAVTSTPADVELKVFGESASSYLVEARNAVRLDVANMTGLPAASLDGSLSTASLTYTTQEGARTELADALQGWVDPIAARLSQDDVVPRGQRVRFDVTDLSTPVPTATGIPVED
jgi:phage portal protein BeeE